jgi:hypothetical protein
MRLAEKRLTLRTPFAMVRGCCKTSKKVSNSFFLLFEQKVGGIISHDRRKSWLILQILKVICSFAQTFRLRKNKNWTITSNFWKTPELARFAEIKNG